MGDISIYHEAVELAKAYAGSGSVKTPTDIEDFLQAAYFKLLDLYEDAKTGHKKDVSVGQN